MNQYFVLYLFTFNCYILLFNAIHSCVYIIFKVILFSWKIYLNVFIMASWTYNQFLMWGWYFIFSKASINWILFWRDWLASSILFFDFVTDLRDFLSGPVLLKINTALHLFVGNKNWLFRKMYRRIENLRSNE